MTCLYIIGIIGTVCVDAPQIGVCHYVGDNFTYCTAHIEELPGLAAWYNPALGGTNCYLDTCATLGDGSPTIEGYGRFMACPIGMYGMTVTFDRAGTWQCRDHGGDINVRYGTRYTYNGWVDSWFIVFDFLLYEPERWTYDLLEIEVIKQ